MSNPITLEFIEKANSALKNARPETLNELFELGRISTEQPAGSWVSGKEILPGVSTMPYYSMGNIADRMMKILYQLDLIIALDWMNWDEGSALLSGNDLETLSGLQPHIIVGLLTALARNDRFCDGAWGAAVENGKVAKLLSELEKQTNGN
ncbi:DUF6508 domain-containing protein [Flavobacteriales bacterium]|nr:DUF6508 domain-containing protein [Flavobacteriales bacterium]